ncbi:MAG TPA: extracellular solute-binding protein [Gemmatimonadales bacterium]|nr:extracellular solute-binding protein [Gemmatimonadales bacterium]
MLALALALALALGLATGCGRERGASAARTLTVFDAGSLAPAFRALADGFRARHPGVDVALESSGSLEAARKITELGRVPDVLAVADAEVIPALLAPAHATWYEVFAGTRYGLLYTDRSAGAAAMAATSADGPAAAPAEWWRVLLRPGVRLGRSDPRLDPAGYRALLVARLAERHYGEPGLAARLDAAVRPGDVRPKSADLVALLQAGELDYAWGYEAVARGAGLRFRALPPAIDLSDPAHAADYAAAQVRIPGPRARPADTLAVRGAPIAYAITIPTQAAEPALARAFVDYVLSDTGRAVLAARGFRLPAAPHPIILPGGDSTRGAAARPRRP